MSGASRVRPWFLRLLDPLPMPVEAAAGLITLILLAANLALGWLAPRAIPPGFPRELLLIYPIALGYLLIAASACLRGARRDLASLRPHLACSEAECADLERAVTQPPRALIATGSLAGVAIPFALAVLGGQDVAGPLRSPPLLLVAFQALLFWIVAVPTFLLVAAGASRFGRIGREHLRVEVFDRRSVQPFVRVGLRVALVLLGFVALRAVFYAYSAPEPLVLANLGPMLVVVALATASLVLPLRGVHARIRAAKTDELARIRRALEQRQDAGRAPLDPVEGVPRAYLNLLEYQARVEAVGEWPFDAPALARFAAYLLIPVGGWVGGALMERLLDALLG